MSLAERLHAVENPKILTVDIETSPHLAHVWGLWDQNVSLNQLRDTGQVISFAAKWFGRKAVEFRSNYHDGHDAMVARSWELFDQAEVVVTWNGKSFDDKHLRREWLLAGFPPPSPWKDVDLLLAARSKFKFASNKLDHVSQALGLDGKVSHTGFQLWLDCLHGDEDQKRKAWALMKRYNMQDVRLTEQVYMILRPWVHTHPHVGKWADDTPRCNVCGSTELQPNGTTRATLIDYALYRCVCGANVKTARHSRAAITRGVA